MAKDKNETLIQKLSRLFPALTPDNKELFITIFNEPPNIHPQRLLYAISWIEQSIAHRGMGE